MKLREHAAAVEDALMAFFVRSSDAQSDEQVVANCKFTAYYITELAKRWAERRYFEKQHGRELTIEEAIARSQEATEKFFERKRRRRAPREMKDKLRETADLRAFLEGHEEPGGEEHEHQDPDQQHEPHQDEPQEVEEQSPAPPSEPVPGSAPYPTVPTEE